MKIEICARTVPTSNQYYAFGFENVRSLVSTDRLYTIVLSDGTVKNFFKEFVEYAKEIDE